MYYYKIYGLNIESDYVFEEAVEIDYTEDIDVYIEKSDLPPRVMGETKEEKAKGDVNVYMCTPDKAWFRWYGIGSFMITNGNRIAYKLLPGCNMLEVNEIFLCIAFFYILYQRKMVILHGSGLVWDDKMFVVSGQSGSGKSTLSEAILKQGAKFLADDTVAVKVENTGIYAMPAYPQQKLCPDQVTDEMYKNYNMVRLAEDGGVSKFGVRMRERFWDEPKKPDAMVIIEKSSEISKPEIKKVSGSDKMKYLIQNLFKYDTYVKSGLDPEVFKKAIQLAGNIDIYILSRPENGITVDAQMELIKQELGINE